MRALITTNSSDSSTGVPASEIQTVPVAADSQGRVRVSREQRRVILAEFERSGVSAAQFAKVTGLKYSTLAGWLQRHRRSQSRKRQQPVRLLEAMVEPTAEGKSAVVIELVCGARLEISDVKQVPLASALLRSLQQPC